ncbi:MAG: enoyl-ACP reductase [Halobacteriovoraceae bacterium]|nr:enoyl-ACP reductase [Halobacteriovoraceae bacterium]
MALLEGKKALILGVANERSIAWGVTRCLKQHGAKLALSFLDDRLKKRVGPLAAQMEADFLCEMDVTVDEHYVNLAKTVKEKWGTFDILVHSLAFADREDLKGNFSNTSRNGFKLACDVSAYSLIGLAKHLRELMNPNGSIMAMTYHGSTKVLKGYNVMGSAKAALEANIRYLAEDLGALGIRVNGISSGPIRTLAASGVSTLKDISQKIEQNAPLKRNVSTKDVGNAAVFLASDLSNAVTGQILYVDAGISIMAM